DVGVHRVGGIAGKALRGKLRVRDLIVVVRVGVVGEQDVIGPGAIGGDLALIPDRPRHGDILADARGARRSRAAEDEVRRAGEGGRGGGTGGWRTGRLSHTSSCGRSRCLDSGSSTKAWRFDRLPATTGR